MKGQQEGRKCRGDAFEARDLKYIEGTAGCGDRANVSIGQGGTC